MRTPLVVVLLTSKVALLEPAEIGTSMLVPA